jgi:hypothetical protein
MGRRPLPERALSLRFRARRAWEVPISHPCLRMSSSHPFVLVVETTNDRSKMILPVTDLAWQAGGQGPSKHGWSLSWG